MSKKPLVRQIVFAAIAVIAAITLTACSSGDEAAEDTSATTTPSGAAKADVTFMQQMIPHHRGAIEMSGLAPSRARSEQVKQLAQRIQSAQQPEIDLMTRLLTDAGKPTEAAGEGHSGMEMSESDPPGHMSDAEMAGLRNVSGSAFDRAFLEMMIRHHEGAVAMAETELANGRLEEVRGLADTIKRSQTLEIAEMRQLLPVV